ncbi:MAG: HRDC domain-containing protein [Lentisphaerae bacterium]|nr:HRDC domain-containing protein [Lentisphaerota bacterium]
MEPIAYELIDRSVALSAALAGLTGQRSLALDLEMESQRHHYGLHIALIQVSTPNERNFIFDPLAGMDLTGLNALLSSAEVELIVHDADFDRRVFRQMYGLNLNRVFDTKIAAQLCGFRKFGLASLLQDLLNIQTDKKFQTFDWLKRPLPKAALEYAARDTAGLHRLKDILKHRLVELGRLDWAREEFQRAELQEDAEEPLPEHYRLKRSTLLTPRQLALLGALTRFRDEVARARNRPVHFIIRNDLLLQLAQKPPTTAQEIRQVKGMHPTLYHDHWQAHFLEAVRRGQALPEERHPRLRKRTRSVGGYEQRLKAMQAWRALVAVPYGLEPYLLLPNDVLQWVARHPQQDLPPDIAGQIRAWQKKIIWEPFKRQFAFSSSI